MVKYVLSKFKEASLSALPILAVIFFLYILEKFGLPTGISSSQYLITDSDMIAFAICTIFIAFGLGLFTIGTEQSMSEIGQLIGGSLTKRRNMFFVVAMTFLLGVFVTIAEPDINVLSDQIGIKDFLGRQMLIWTMGAGVGLFLVIGVLRVLFQKNLNIMFLAFYAIIFSLTYFVDKDLLPLCFDSGGVTTGPVTVPFILAFGVGIAASRAGSQPSGDESFGMSALCSIGPIFTVMIISRLIHLPPAYPINDYLDVLNTSVVSGVGQNILAAMYEVGLAIIPIVLLFVVYELIVIRLPFIKLLKILMGLVYAFIGLTFFLTAVRSGFLPVAFKVGLSFGENAAYLPIAIGFGFLFGFFGVLAEPGVHVLGYQVESVSEGTIKKNFLLGSLAISIGIAVALQIVRAYFRFDIMYYLLPGYAIALILTFLVPKIYTAIAFDSGGVASGPMTSTFISPFCIGFAFAIAPDYVFQYGFGLVTMVSMMPIIVLQVFGFFIKIRKEQVYKQARRSVTEPNDNQIIHFEEEKA